MSARSARNDPQPRNGGKSAGRNLPSGIAAMTGWLTALSGFSCLIYQVLWMRQTGLLFGSTSQATALTLAVFFGGLSTGGWFWGRRCRTLRNPMRACGWLEAGIALAGGALLIAPSVVPRIHPQFADAGGEAAVLFAFRLGVTLLLVFPASFLMGGTLPLLGQAVIRRRKDFGTLTARMYALNTIGAACGAFATAFVLIWLIGIRLTCATAMAASAAAALLAFRLSRREAFGNPPSLEGDDRQPQDAGMTARESPSIHAPLPRSLISFLAFLSGFNLLVLEVVWTRMLAQVHENSVYSFATVLIVVLACLALGAWLASRLARPGIAPARVLTWLFVAGGAALALTPLMVHGLTRGMTMLETDSSFAGYALRLFLAGLLAIAPACLPLGAVFPFLMKCEEPFISQAGRSIGSLASINTVGAILGPLAAGFFLLEWLGVWHSLQLVASIYLVIALLTPLKEGRGARIAAAALLLLLLAVLVPFGPGGRARTDPAGRVVETWEGSDCTVTVVGQPGGNLSIRINSNYSLGSTDAYRPQVFQARIPLLAWPETDSVFFLGMGTGITAGEALNRGDFPKVERVVATELSPGVVAASRKYFAGGPGGIDLTQGLYQDPRARVLVADGRNHLLAHRDRYAMINADLFLPYRRGTGNLYSKEHFETIRSRLQPGGVFVQWLPLYQVSDREFGIITRTMLAVFPQVSLWRGNFQPGAEIAAIVGHRDDTPLPACTVDAAEDKRLAVEGVTHLDMQDLMLPVNPETVTLFYGGNLTRAANLFREHPLNTDDRPLIEFGTPRSLHQPRGAGPPQFLESRFADLVDRLQAITPPAADPLLAWRSAGARRLPLAGSAFHRAWIARVHGDGETWQREWEAFRSHWLDPE